MSFRKPRKRGAGASADFSGWIVYICGLTGTAGNLGMVDKAKIVQVNEGDLPLIGIQQAPEFFVDGYQGASVNNGIAKVHYFTIIFDPITEKMTRRVVYTMVVPVNALVSIADAQTKLVEQLKTDGVVVPVVELEKSNA
jgi:hypothetical protein